jgi:DNA-binding NtrC family response regulator
LELESPYDAQLFLVSLTEFQVPAIGLVGCSEVHRVLLARLSKFATTDAEILITGPTGVGKELYARYVHCQSPRVKAAFVPVNCGAIPDTLLENELFGHVSGAFTGAQPQSEGLVAAAEGGTLFLDEIDTLSIPCQVKLLRFIQEKEYRRLGEARTRRANLRFIAATNADLLTAVQTRRFREDLFFRLRVIPIEVPALWKRPEDIRPLFNEYVGYYAELYALPAITMGATAWDKVETYTWPGNVRELENCVQYLTCLQVDRPIQAEDLPLLSVDEEEAPAAKWSGISDASFQSAKRELVDMFEKEYLEGALRRSRGNIAEAARASGKARRAFFELMRKHGVKAVNHGQGSHEQDN